MWSSPTPTAAEAASDTGLSRKIQTPDDMETLCMLSNCGIFGPPDTALPIWIQRVAPSRAGSEAPRSHRHEEPGATLTSFKLPAHLKLLLLRSRVADHTAGSRIFNTPMTRFHIWTPRLSAYRSG